MISFKLTNQTNIISLDGVGCIGVVFMGIDGWAHEYTVALMAHHPNESNYHHHHQHHHHHLFHVLVTDSV